MDALLFVIGIIGNVISILVFLSPILTFWRIVKSQSTEYFEPAPYVVTLLCCSLSVYYDVIKPGEYLVATINGIGVVLEFIYVFLFLIYAPSSARVKTLILVAVLDVGFFGGVMLFLQLVVEKSFHIMVMGVISASLNVAMYASPLAVMSELIVQPWDAYKPDLSIDLKKHYAPTNFLDKVTFYLVKSSANAKSGGGTLPITARTLETMIRLSTAHTKLKLRNQVLKIDVEASLKVLNFAIYHKELTDMEDREKERELEMKRKADNDAANDENVDAGESTVDVMVVDDHSAASEVDTSPERIQAFEAILAGF